MKCQSGGNFNGTIDGKMETNVLVAHWRKIPGIFGDSFKCNQ